MKSHRAFWVTAAVSVVAAVAALTVREGFGNRTGGPAAEQERVTAEMIGALDFDPRLRRPVTQRLVEVVSRYSQDQATATAESFYALGLRKYYGDFDTEAARDAFERARRLRPEWAWPVNGLAIVEFVAGKRDDAMRLFADALRMEPGWSRPHADMAILLRRSGDVAEALEHAQAALSIEPDHPINHYNYGVILDELGRRAEAREEYQRTIAIMPNLPQAQYNLACSYARDGDLEDALAPLTKAISLEPEFIDDAGTDPDFDVVRGDPRFAAILRGNEAAN